jgi:hypothetical protein
MTPRDLDSLCHQMIMFWVRLEYEIYILLHNYCFPFFCICLQNHLIVIYKKK